MLLSIQDFMADNFYTPSSDNYAVFRLNKPEKDLQAILCRKLGESWMHRYEHSRPRSLQSSWALQAWTRPASRSMIQEMGLYFIIKGVSEIRDTVLESLV